MFYKKINYPDGDFYVELLEPKKEFTFRVNSYEDLWEMNHLIEALNHNGIIPCVTIPNLLSCQADRRFKENQSFGYNLVHNFLKSLNATFKIFHPHQEMCSLLDNIEIIDNTKFVQSVLQTISSNEMHWLSNQEFQDNTILLAPDRGAYKWIMKLADKLGWKGEVFAASKSRKFEEGKTSIIQMIDRKDFEGKRIILLDDLCIYGGTFVGLAKLLRDRNAGQLYLAVSHITVAKPNPLLFELFDVVFTTNSKGLVYHDEENHPENLDVIELF